MIIENKGIKTDTFYIPPFNLEKGEVVVLYLHNCSESYDVEMLLKSIFCGTVKDENVIIHKKLKFVEHFKESNLRRYFCPITVGEYLRKNTDLNSSFSEKIFETNWITNKTKVNTLPGNPRKLLSLYATLSKTKNIVFDLVGQDPQGVEFAFEMVKEAVKNDGSAILFYHFDGLKEHCSKYIELEWVNHSGSDKDSSWQNGFES
ncbi:hypothetical protein LNQ49_19265 [Flavobacterium sp. F-65]|uniref:Uncharacterized protein n=1 Tax=Flavobacterium pisciphilum TaxID=2893755 RepID=A0ABS8MY72_9FLAO|nr:hypothetical protein [Flavobacterium sp. F-65]MCC9073724.1 hypothetical protein [Flavobacterium sp. F-65]